jgi:hypothetical protein
VPRPPTTTCGALAGVGYDPAAAWNFFATHPPTSERVATRLGTPARVTTRRSATSSGAWSAEEAAVANEVAPGDVLAGGRPVKVVITEPYVAGY